MDIISLYEIKGYICLIKEGILFTIIIPFLSVLLISFLSISFYMKISAENLNSDITNLKSFIMKIKRYYIRGVFKSKELEYKLRIEVFKFYICGDFSRNLFLWHFSHT